MTLIVLFAEIEVVCYFGHNVEPSQKSLSYRPVVALARIEECEDVKTLSLSLDPWPLVFCVLKNSVSIFVWRHLHRLSLLRKLNETPFMCEA